MVLIVIYLISEIKYIENHLPKKVAAEEAKGLGKNLCTIHYITRNILGKDFSARSKFLTFKV